MKFASARARRRRQRPLPEGDGRSGSGPAAHGSHRPAANPAVTVATYNIHSCVGLDRRCDPDRIVAVIREIDADIIALQEVDARRRRRRRNWVDQFEYLIEATGLQGIAGRSLVQHSGSFGNALLSRWPIGEFRRLDISFGNWREPRGAIDAQIHTAAGPVRVVATHLGLSLRERQSQVAALLDALDSTGGGEDCVLLGDLNEWRRWGGSLRPLMERMQVSPLQPTFPAWRPMLPLDRIFTSGGTRFGDLEVHRSPLSRLASDHLPLKAVIERPLAGE